MSEQPTDRIATLDLIRGVAVLGILAVNIAAYAGPGGGTLSPNFPVAASPADELIYAAELLVFEGKMRALFSMLFGASMLLFIDRADQAGRDGQGLQLRRLGWLALFGYLHFLLLWWGDILFLYALAGLAALPLRRAPAGPLIASALLLFTVWQGFGTWQTLPQAEAEAAISAGTANTQQRQLYAEADKQLRQNYRSELAETSGSYADQLLGKATNRPALPLKTSIFTIGETLSYVLIGMALLRSGFFSGGWNRKRLRLTALLGVGIGGVLTAFYIGWALPRGFPVMAMLYATIFGLGFPHLLMALGYAALLVLAAPRLLASRLGERLVAAGRMAFSNYLGTSLLMTFCFYGWGLGLTGEIPRAALPLFVLGVWLVMLTWSKPWLAYFRQGPLEWLWRVLTEWRAMPLRR